MFKAEYFHHVSKDHIDLAATILLIYTTSMAVASGG